MQLYVLLALCGVALAKQTFIIGGRNVTEPGKWPWMVRLKKVISINIHCKGSAVIGLYHCTKSHDMGNTIWCRVFTALWVTNIILLYFLSCVVSCHK